MAVDPKDGPQGEGATALKKPAGKKRGRPAKPKADKPKRPTGRPAFRPTEKQIGFVLGCVDAGFDRETIAKKMIPGPSNPQGSIHIDTLEKYFGVELLETGDVSLIALAAGTLRTLLKGRPAKLDKKGRTVNEEIVPSLGAACFVMKTRGAKVLNNAWSEKPGVVTNAAGQNGAEYDLTKLTDEQIAKIDEATALLELVRVGTAPATTGGDIPVADNGGNRTTAH